MNRFILLFVLASAISLGIILNSCKKNPTEPEPIQQPSPSISVIIQSPTTEEGYVTTNEKISVAGIVISANPIKEVKWKSLSTQGSATGTDNWTIAEVPIQEGDNSVIVTATDNSSLSSSDTIIITKNKYLNFLSKPQFTPSSIPVNEPTDVHVQIEIAPVSNLNVSAVKLVEIDKSNNIIAETVTLYDDGVLSHGDDIQGDNVYNSIINMSQSQTGSKRFRVVAQTDEVSGPVQGKSSVNSLDFFARRDLAVYEEQTKLQTTAAEKLYNFAYDNKNVKTALNKTAEWLNTQSNVKSATVEGDRTILVKYSSGQSGLVIAREVDQNGKPLYFGSGSTPANSSTSWLDSRSPVSRKDTIYPKRVPRLKPFEQTKGEFHIFPNNFADADTHLILNKDVLLWGACEDDFAQEVDVAAEIEKRLAKNKMGLYIKHLVAGDATISEALHFDDYGMVILMAHGAYGMYVESKEEVTPQKNQLYHDLLDKKDVVINTGVYIASTLWTLIPLKTGSTYGFYPSFVQKWLKKFPKTIVVALDCESATMDIAYASMIPKQYTAFLEKGVSAYIGYTGYLTPTFANETAPDFIENLVVGEKNIFEAFKSKKTNDPYPNEFYMHGSSTLEPVRFTSGMINGQFEYSQYEPGEIVGWDHTGDARVIRIIGSEKAQAGNNMGIISTGFGSVTQSGSISQDFRIKDNESELTIKWLFLSEEFLEFINSKYQDSFKITLNEINAQENVLLEKTIDQIAIDFGATKESPGNLKARSDIKFDQGGVYGTPWMISKFDVSAYRGKVVRLTISVHDVGDSAYDTAILLDEISVK
jgi:hypothetical protein